MSPLEENHLLGLAGKSTTQLITKEPSWKEIQKTVKHARAASAPSPSSTHTLQSIQKVLQTTLEAVETHLEDLVKRHHSSKLEKGRRLFCPQRSMLLSHKPVEGYLLSQCRRQDLLLSAG